MEMKKSLIKLQCVAALMLTVGAPTMQSVSLVHADTTTQTQKDATSFEAKLTSKSEQPGTVLLRHTGGKELSLTKVELIDKDGKSLATIYDAAKEDASVTKKGDDIFVKFNAPKAEGMTVKVSYDKSKLGDKEAIATVAVLLKDNGGTAAAKQFNAKTESKDAINKSMDDALNELKELNKDTSKKEDDSKKDDTSKKDDSKKDESKKDDSKKDDSKKEDTPKKEDDSKKDDSKKDDTSKKDDSKKDETKPSTDLKKEDTNKKDDKLPETKPSTDDKKDDVKKDETKPSTDVKKDETKPSTDVKKDDVKKDETKPSTDVKKDDVKKDETKPSTDLKKDDVKKEEGNGKNDRPSLDDLKKDETKPSTDVKKDETKTAPTADAKNLFAPIVKEKYDLSTHRVDRAKTISELLVSSYEKASKNSKLSDDVKSEKEAADKAVANLKAEAAKTSATPESLNKAYSLAFDAVKALSDKIDGKVSNTVKKDDVKKDETKPSTDVKKDVTKPSTDVKKDDVKKDDVKKDDVKKDETKPSTDVKKDEVKSDDTKKDETAPSSDVKKDEVKSDDAKKDETKPSTDVKQDQTQPSSSAKIQGKAPIKGKYANTNEKTNPIAVIAGALGLALAGIAGVIGWKKHKESNENESSEN